jgi:hypothetical protein
MKGEFSCGDGPPQQGADPNSRLGDPTLRKLHYQTGPISPVNSAKTTSVATINHEKTLRNLIECRSGHDDNMTEKARGIAIR